MNKTMGQLEVVFWFFFLRNGIQKQSLQVFEGQSGYNKLHNFSFTPTHGILICKYTCIYFHKELYLEIERFIRSEMWEVKKSIQGQ